MKIAVIGASCRFPGGVDSLAALWELLLSGQDAVTELPADRFDLDAFSHPLRSAPGRSRTFAAGVIDNVEGFDCEFFGISKTEAEFMDPQQRLLLELAWEALEDALTPPAALAGSDAAVFIGASSLDAGMLRADDPCVIGPYSMLGNTLSILANRISHLFDLKGPSLTVDTACSSSLTAFHLACQSLIRGEASTAITGGVHILCHPLPFIGFSKARMLAAGGRCRVFDEKAEGYVRAEGGGLVLLKPLDQALADGDRIHAVVTASGLNADGRTIGVAKPNGDAQAALLHRLYTQPGVDPANLAYIEAHGTGTPAGDPVEVRAVGETLRALRPDGPPLPIGSIKSNLGHLEPASGAAGVFKALLTLKHGVIPKNLHLRKTHPDIDFAGLKLVPVVENTPLPTTPGPPLVGVNSFGFGGANAHLVLERAPTPKDALSPSAALTASTLTAPPPPLVLSAASPAGLAALAGRWAEWIEKSPPEAYPSAAALAALRRARLPHRLVAGGESLKELALNLRRTAAGESPDDRDGNLVFGEALAGAPGVALVFSGNGDNWAGLWRTLVLGDPDAAKILDELEALFSPLLGWSLRRAMTETDAEPDLSRIEIAQPILFALQVCFFQALIAKGVKPTVVYGHSIGEAAAAYASGALSLADAAKVVAVRSRLQAESRGTGGMAVVQLSLEEAAALPEIVHGELEIAAVNSSRHLTLTGPGAVLDSLGKALRKRRVVYKRLPLEHPFHSRFMDPLCERLERELSDIAPRRTTIPLISTVDGEIVAGTELGPVHWRRNLREPVLFVQATRKAFAYGARLFVEIGPAPLLQPFLKHSLREFDAPTAAPSAPTNSAQDSGAAEVLWRKLFTLGADIDFSQRFPVPAKPGDLPSTPWLRERCAAASTPECLGLFSPKPKAHPLLGRQVRRDLPVFEQTLDPHLTPLLADHVIGGDVVMPGAGFLETALAAAHTAFGGDVVELENVELRRPMLFATGKSRIVRTTVGLEDGLFRIESREVLQDAAPIQHIRGRIVPKLRKKSQAGAAPVLDPAEFGSAVDAAHLYAQAAASDLAFGPAFRALAQVHRRGDAAFAKLELPQSIDETGFHLYPGRIDAAFQLLLALVDWREKGLDSFTYLPVRIGGMRLFGAGPATFALARLEKQSRHSLLASFSLYDARGRELAALNDCRFARLQTRSQVQRRQEVYAPVFVAVKSPLDESPSALAGPDRFQAAVKAVQTARQASRPLREAQRAEQAEHLLTAFFLSRCRELLATVPMPKQGGDLEEWLFSGRIDQALAPFVAHCFGELERVGAARVENGRLSLGADPLPESGLIGNAVLLDHPDHALPLALLQRIGDAAHDILRGVRPLSEVYDLKPGSEAEAYERFAPWAQNGVRAVRDAVRALVGQGLPGGVDVLEIDAADGTLTEATLDLLPPLGRSYTALDPDELFIELLKNRFRDKPGFVARCADPALADAPVLAPADALEDAGPKSALFDLVLLNHPLRRRERPTDLIAAAVRRLRPGGVLLVLESAPHPLRDLVRGLDPAWWREDGAELKPRSLAPAEWTAELARAGLTNPTLASDERDAELVVAAWAPQDTSAESRPALSPTRRRIILVDEAPTPFVDFLVDALRKRLGQGEHAPIVLKAGSPIAGAGKPFRPLDPKSWDDLFAAYAAADRPLDCIHLLGLDGEPDPEPERLQALLNARVQTSLLLVQAWKRVGRPVRLAYVTRGALPLDTPEARPVPSQAGLAGLRRVLANEAPGLHTRLIDLHCDALDPAFADAVAVDLLNPERDEHSPSRTAECEIVHTPKGRFEPRLYLFEEAAEAQADRPDAAQLEPPPPGRLDAVHWRALKRPVPGPGQVLIRTKAAGVNFRDVMFALGRLPEEALENGASGPTLGLESAGVVLEVGENVAGLAPGDRVVALGGGLYDDLVLAPAQFVFPLPEEVDFLSAAAFPTALFTAWYSLKHLARLAPGESVLIHGGAGGVGQAALAVARMLGARVFASAGSETKRRLLAGQGVECALDSRSHDFEDVLRQATNGRGVDVVLNSLSGEALLKSVGLLAPLGRFLELGKVDFYSDSSLRMRLLRHNITFFGVDVDQVMLLNPGLCRTLFAEILEHRQTGELPGPPYLSAPRRDIGEAFRLMQHSRHIGKIVLDYADGPVAARPLPAPPLYPPADKGAVLITGGFGGLGLATAERFARAGAKRLILLGRTGAADKERKRRVEALRTLGAEVAELAVDATDYGALKAALSPFLETGTLKGVVHCAVDLRDASVFAQNPQDAAAVLAAKALSAHHLHRLTRDVRLDFFILFSSAVTTFGNPGQAAYTAANAALETLAVYRRRLGLPATAIGFGPVQGVGLLKNKRKTLDSLAELTGAVPLLAEQVADFVFAHAHAPKPVLHVFRFNFAKLARLPYVASRAFSRFFEDGAASGDDFDVVDVKRIVRELSPKEAQNRIAELLAARIAHIVRTPLSRVPLDKPLADLGMDSLMYVELGLSTEAALGVDVSTLALDRSATIRSLAGQMRALLDGAAPTGDAEAHAVAKHIAQTHGATLSVESAKKLLAAPPDGSHVQ